MNSAERRAGERLNVNAATACNFFSPVLEDLGDARIQGISNEGIGLIVQHKLEPGLLLAINVVNTNRSFSRTMLVRVVHVTPKPGDFYFVGGKFQTPLTYEELKALVM